MGLFKPTLVRMKATCGANCSTICRITIGRYAIIGVASVVTKNISDHVLVVGNAGQEFGQVCVGKERLTENLRCMVCDKSMNNANAE